MRCKTLPLTVPLLNSTDVEDDRSCPPAVTYKPFFRSSKSAGACLKNRSLLKTGWLAETKNKHS